VGLADKDKAFQLSESDRFEKEQETKMLHKYHGHQTRVSSLKKNPEDRDRILQSDSLA